MVELRPTRSGHTTATCNGISIHSAYDPVREARRFVASLPPGDPPSTAIVLGEGVGHVCNAVRARYPGCRLLAVHYATELWQSAGTGSSAAADASWHPGSAKTLSGFLRAAVTELDVEGLRLLEWPPSSAAFPDLCRLARQAALQLVRELNGNVATTVRSGRRWLHNSVLNFLFGPDPEPRLPLDPALPVVIAASGPSLADDAAIIRELRGRVNLWALPSAVEYLLAAGLEPDLVVLTDPVYYSIYHLHAARGRSIPVALPLSAAPGAWRVTSRVIYLSQPTFYEPALLSAFRRPFVSVPPSGTVAGTALALALAATPSGTPIVFAGLDLCYRDVLSHARPNAFEHFLLSGTGRRAPFCHRVCSGAMDAAPVRMPGTTARTSLPLQTYAGWFASGSPAWEGRVRRLHPSPVEIPALAPIDPDGLRRLCPPRSPSAPGRAAPAAALGRADRRQAAHALIAVWRELLSREAGVPPEGPTPAREIAAHLALRELLDMRRRARVEGPAGTRELWKALVLSVDSCLGTLEGIVQASGDV